MFQSAKWLLGATLILASALHAQNEIPPLTEKSQLTARSTKIVKVRNVHVETIAHWLEPSKYAPSMMEKNSVTAWVNSGHDGKDAPRLQPPVPIVLPPSVSIREVSQGNNALFIMGKAEEMEQTEKLIRQLDQPLKQVEIECFVIGVDDAALKAANLYWTPIGKTFSGVPLQQAKINGLYQLTNAWAKAKQSEALTAPRIVAIDGLAADLRSETITTSSFKIYNGKEYVEFSPNDAALHSPPSFIESLGMSVLPRIQRDGMIQAHIQVSRNLFLGFYKRPTAPIAENRDLQAGILKEGLNEADLEKVPAFGWGIEQDRHLLRHAEGFEREIVVKDGETLAFSGGKAEALLGSAILNGQARKLRGKTLVAFVTMREIRRLEPPVPGT